MVKIGDRIRHSIKSLVGIGTSFIENGVEQVVTRVTDLHFDTIDKDNQEVKVRSLRLWDSAKFTNSISGVTGLLRVR